MIKTTTHEFDIPVLCEMDRGEIFAMVEVFKSLMDDPSPVYVESVRTDLVKVTITQIECP